MLLVFWCTITAKRKRRENFGDVSREKSIELLMENGNSLQQLRKPPTVGLEIWTGGASAG
jgi:hypothetical protein